MFDGLDHVTKAVQILLTADPGFRDRLQAAGAEVAVTLLQPEEWPAHLLESAKLIPPRCRKAHDLTHGEALQLADDLQDLWRDVGTARRKHDRQDW